MREPKPFFRSQTQSWYVQFGKDQVPLGRDEKKAWDKYHELMTARRNGEVLSDEAVATALNRHLAWARDNRSKATFDKKLRHLKSFGRYVGPKLKLSQLRGYHVQRWIDKHYADASETYRHIAISEVQTALNWAVRLQYIPKNPIARFPKPRPAMRETVVPAVKWPEILAAIRDRQFRDYIVVMITTGARAQEMPKIEARHFDREYRRIVFPKKESKGQKRARVIYLPDEAFGIVDRLARQNPSGPIFRNTKGRPWSKNTVKSRFKRLKKKLRGSFPWTLSGDGSTSSHRCAQKKAPSPKTHRAVESATPRSVLSQRSQSPESIALKTHTTWFTQLGANPTDRGRTARFLPARKGRGRGAHVWPPHL